jgi:trimeric autotransporter adhesin
VLVAIGCWAIAPASAHAALLDSTVQSTVEAVPQPVQKAAQEVVGAARPAAGSEPAAPAPHADGGAVQQTVAPIAGTTGAAVPSPAVAVSAGHLREPGHGRVSHISASASRRSSGERAERPGTSNRAASSPSRSAARTATGPRPTRQAEAAASAARSASPAQQAPEPRSGLSGADGASAGSSSGFFFGGGLALLVAALLLAGPRLRRRLSPLPVVCRPVAFLVVLERPG